MNIGIGAVFKLTGKKPTIVLSQLFCRVVHANAALLFGCEHNFGAQKAHEPSSLDRKALGHCNNERVTLSRTDHGKANPGVTRCRFNHSLPRREQSIALGGFDNIEGKTVFYRGERVKRLDLDVQRDMRRARSIETNARCIAHCLHNIVVASSATGGCINRHANSPSLVLLM